MSKIRYFLGTNIPLEMHKARIVQKLRLIPIEERLQALSEGGNNTFLLKNRDVFLDMLTDSGTNAMSDHQLAASMMADDAYAGSETYYRLEARVLDFFQKRFFLPAHQGRACENIISKILVAPGKFVLTNYHFTTSRAHVILNGGEMIEIVKEEGADPDTILPFKGDSDLDLLVSEIKRLGAQNISFMRIEMGTNLIGGQPVSLANIEAIYQICQENKIITVIDASLLADNLYFNKIREAQCQNMSIEEICHRISKCGDIIYFSGRKLGCARGGGIATSDENLYKKMRELVPIYEGFMTYGGMSVKEMESMTVGLEETFDFEMINQGPIFIEKMCELLQEHHIPLVLPAGGLGCHLNATKFVEHLPQSHYRSASLVAALYIVSGIRGMERGTVSENRNEDGSEHFAKMELVRLALPRRVFTLSQIHYAVDRIVWLFQNRHLIGGLRFCEEPKIMRFFLGRLEPLDDWQEKLVAKFRQDFGDSL